MHSVLLFVFSLLSLGAAVQSGLYGLSEVFDVVNPGTSTFSYIEPKTGVFSNISTVPYLPVSTSVVIQESKNEFVTILYDPETEGGYLTALNLADGQALWQARWPIAFPQVVSDYTYAFVYDDEADTYYTATQTPDTFYVHKLNGDLIFAYPLSSDFNFGAFISAGFDSESKVWYWIFALSSSFAPDAGGWILTGLDITSGSVLLNSTLVGPSRSFILPTFFGVVFDAKTNTLFASGYSLDLNTPFLQTCSIDLSTGTLSVLKTFETSLNSSPLALDEKNRLAYAFVIGYGAGSMTNNLIAFSLDSGATVTTSPNIENNLFASPCAVYSQ